ncbi:MAG: GatB/YqeY domain-containing protein [Bacteroidetes bacterium]|nr:GatB/YqeY domain-containing protein [Bacteroidota bacterium]
MALTEKINEDLKTAMKSGDQVLLNTIRSIRAQIIEFTKRGGKNDLSQDDEITILLSAIKKRKESIEMYEKGGRTDLAEQERRELEIISAYLPRQITREEAETIIESIIKQVGATTSRDFGKVMSLAMKELKGKIDGNIVQEIVKLKLGN